MTESLPDPALAIFSHSPCEVPWLAASHAFHAALEAKARMGRPWRSGSVTSPSAEAGPFSRAYARFPPNLDSRSRSFPGVTSASG